MIITSTTQRSVTIKKVILIVTVFLLTLELLAGLIAVGMLLSGLGAFSYLVAAGLFAVVLTPFFKKIKQTDDPAQKDKLLRKILGILLIPIAIALVVVILVVVGLWMLFG